MRYRCHTGHAFTARQPCSKIRASRSLEETLWVALRMMEERKNLLSGMAARAAKLPLQRCSRKKRIEEMKKHINRLREFLLNGAGVPPTPEVE